MGYVDFSSRPKKLDLLALSLDISMSITSSMNIHHDMDKLQRFIESEFLKSLIYHKFVPEHSPHIIAVRKLRQSREGLSQIVMKHFINNSSVTEICRTQWITASKSWGKFYNLLIRSNFDGIDLDQLYQNAQLVLGKIIKEEVEAANTTLIICKEMEKCDE